MSHDATSWAKAQRTGHGTAKLILLLLADYAGTDYSCYPSVKKLAEVSELAESTVRSMTKLLAEQGLIRVFYRYRDNRTRRSSRYQLLVDGPETMEPDADDWDHHRQVPAEVQRQEPADTPQEPADSHRQELALIPYKEPSPREPSLVTPGASRTPKATRLPDDFLPTEEMKHWFAAENLHLVINDPRTEHETFCDYWHAKAGADARKLDWAATWRNWMRKAASRGNGGGASGAYRSGPTGPVGPNGTYRSTTDTKVQQTLNLAEKYRQMEESQ